MVLSRVSVFIIVLSILGSICVSAIPHPVSAATICVTLTQDLKLESVDATTNGEVTKLQRFLAQYSDIYPQGKIDGYYGPDTRVAVFRWQKSHGLLPSDTAKQGSVDAKTRASISNCKKFSLTLPASTKQSYTQSSTIVSQNGCPVFSKTLGRGSSGASVRALQDFLIGFNLLSADSASGYYGPKTEAAVQKWQSSRGIISSGDASTGFGVLGPRTRAHIAARCTDPVVVAQGSANTEVSMSSSITCNTSVFIPACATGFHRGGTCNLSCIPDGVADNNASNVSNVSSSFSSVSTPPPAPTPTPSPSPSAAATASPTPPAAPVSLTQVGASATLTAYSTGQSVVQFSGSYNTNNLCDGETFNIDFGDEASVDLPVSCSSSTYTKSHTYEPGSYYVEIDKVTTDTEGSQTFTMQAQMQVIVSDDGAITLAVVPAGTR